MTDITIIDAIMGSGKTTAAMNYMLEHENDTKFFYVTPYLKEVSRVCKYCSFDEPTDNLGAKLTALKELLRDGKHIATTHSLFTHMDSEAMGIIREQHYTLIMDESFQVIRKLDVCPDDITYIATSYTTEASDGQLAWRDSGYNGVFRKLKAIADNGQLYHSGGQLLSVLNPDRMLIFDKAFVLTYLFKGNTLNAYFDLHKLKYNVWSIAGSGDNAHFSDTEEDDVLSGLRSLVTLIQDDQINDIGNRDYSLSSSWYMKAVKKKERNCRDIMTTQIKILEGNLDTFFRRRCGSDHRLWTCFKAQQPKFGRYKKDFLQLAAKSTNEFSDRVCVAYLVNRYLDPNYKNFFTSHGVVVDNDVYALSEMLQWIWRSGIRVGKHITLYIPSRRMRLLFLDWLDSVDPPEFSEATYNPERSAIRWHRSVAIDEPVEQKEAV